MSDFVRIPAEGTRRRLDSLKSKILSLTSDVINSGEYISGTRVAALEKYLNSKWGRNSVTTNSGNSALQLALLAAGVTPGDEVIVPALTHISTAYAVSAVGAIPSFVDIDPHTLTIDLQAVKNAIREETVAVIAVHLYGQMVDMQPLMEFASESGLKVIEDVAHAHGAKYKDNYAGCIGDFGCFSMYLGKKLGGLEDGGFITVSNPEDVLQLKSLRDPGKVVLNKYIHQEFGFRARMGEFTAAVIGLELEFLEDWNCCHQKIAARYNAAFASLPFQTPTVKDECDRTFYKYVILLDSVQERLALENRLERLGIQTENLFSRTIPEQPVYALGLPCRVEPLTVAKEVTGRLLSLPIYPELEEQEVDAVITAMHQAYKKVLVVD
ncbi:DegT/DnrJ/EryC1/StrS family aminotransferase [Mastigocoleus sp. MO_188.B34]|uniref:DegT/DnrJ/EryC1/StrS family aminotransferase n=1 Tax=Mastigocoleus sp. MO_188.B34 TaxID=3036635 RepID=UPI00261C99AA|nr:DegT/DnrJ/EryC1/StrS family aminotransferase [Mastigocoleus sp. MO_188.B34]MDJ0697299.1 DegT/DnrJ/EryC1/StrS family aminotransferase [Mastigocoleus sp. MO_188.B34]